MSEISVSLEDINKVTDDMSKTENSQDVQDVQDVQETQEDGQSDVQVGSGKKGKGKKGNKKGKKGKKKSNKKKYTKKRSSLREQVSKLSKQVRELLDLQTPEEKRPEINVMLNSNMIKVVEKKLEPLTFEFHVNGNKVVLEKTEDGSYRIPVDEESEPALEAPAAMDEPEPAAEEPEPEIQM